MITSCTQTLGLYGCDNVEDLKPLDHLTAKIGPYAAGDEEWWEYEEV